MHCVVQGHSFSPPVAVVKDENENRKSRYLWSAFDDQFLNAKNDRPAEIHSQIVEVYGEGAANEGNVRKWEIFE